MGTASADSSGRVQVNYPIPELPNGAISVELSSDNLATPLTTTATISPRVIFSTTSAAIGDEITVRGTGFNPTEKVKVEVSGTIPADLSEITVGDLGSFGFDGDLSFII